MTRQVSSVDLFLDALILQDYSVPFFFLKTRVVETIRTIIRTDILHSAASPLKKQNTHDQQVENTVEVEKPKIIKKPVQPIENTHDQHVTNTVEVEKPKIIKKPVQLIENTHDQQVENRVDVEKPKIIKKTAQPIKNTHNQHVADTVEVENLHSF